MPIYRCLYYTVSVLTCVSKHLPLILIIIMPIMLATKAYIYWI